MKNLNLFLCSLLLPVLSLAQSPNFSEDVAPIIYNHCTSCHRSGEIGPMPFTSYNEVVAWGSMIKYVTEIRYMPPWQPDPEYSTFLGENYLTDAEIQTIADWMAAGFPQGDPALEPSLPDFPTGSVLGEPDLVLSFDTTYFHEGDNEDEYRVFVLPTGLTEDKDLAAIELRPGNRQIVHHALFSWDTTGQAQQLDAQDPDYGYDGFGGFGLPSTFDNQYPGYVPGQIPRFFPEGMGQRMYEGSDLLVQMHYAPWAVDATDSSTVNIFFKNEPVQRYVDQYVMLPLPGVLQNGPFVIQADSVKRFHGTFTSPIDASLLGIAPHCHLLGVEWEVFMVHPNGDTTRLINIPEWDFNWQGMYLFDHLVKVDAGTEIHAFCTYDNTLNNPLNPNNPPKFVSWGEKTTDEMFYLPFAFVPYQAGDELINLTTDALDDLVVWPEDKLYKVFPNPTTGEVHVGFSLGDNQRISIGLYTLDGKLVQQVIQNRFYPVGNHQIRFEAEQIPNGVYLVRIEGKGFRGSEKLILER